MNKDKHNYVLLRYHVPTSFGIPGMRTAIVHRTGKQPFGNTTYVAVSESERRLVIATFSSEIGASVLKQHCPGDQYDFQRIMKGRRGHGLFKISKAEYEQIFKMVWDKSSK